MQRGWLAALCALAVGCSSQSRPGAGFGPDGGVANTFQETVVAVARLDGTSGHGTAPDTESFDGTQSHSSSGASVTCHWDFGDGASSEQCRTTHVFSQPGTLTVVLTAEDPDGHQGTASLTVEVDPPAIRGVVAIAKLDGTPGHGTAPDTERFDGNQSHSDDPAARITSCSWEFGDGETASGCNASHTFTRAGSYTVTLTAKDSNGDRGTASLGVSVQAPTLAPASAVRWARSTPDTTLVGSDPAGQAVIAHGAVLEGIDPATGATRWTHSYAYPSESITQFEFWGPLFISPASSEIFAQVYLTGPTNWRGDCAFTPDGSGQKDCYLHGMDSYVVRAPQMASDGTIAGFTDYAASDVIVRGPDATTWSVRLSQEDGSHAPKIDLEDAAAEPGGDVVIAGTAEAGYSWDGQAIGPARVLMRLSPGGKIVWWRPLPFDVLDLGTSAAGTVVGIGKTSSAIAWADQALSAGTYLFIVDAAGTTRLARKLDDAVSGMLSVLPKGQVGIALGRMGCDENGGAIIDRYDLAGDLLFRTDFGRDDCAVHAFGISIRSDDLLVSGKLSQPVDFGTGTLSAGGFVLDLDG